MARTAKVPQKIKDILQKNHLLSVPQMMEIFEKKGEKYNKTSIYRALEKLHKNGEVCKQTFVDNEALYELREDHHDHALCTKCEKIVPIECSHEEEKQIPGFVVNHHHTTIYGLCNNCANSSKK